MKTRKTVSKFLAYLVVAVFAFSLISVGSAGADGKKYAQPYNPTWGWVGYNSMIQDYYFDEGYPTYDHHPRWLGELSGSWYQIGKQYGQRAGDLIRMVFEGWYTEVLPAEGSTEAIIEYVHQQEAYLKNLVPEALKLMKGISVGAEKELDKSVYADQMTHYEKVLMINSYFALQAGNGGGKPGGSGGSGDGVGGCSGAVILGAGTKDGKIIHVSSEDQHFFPQEYLVAYIVSPSDKKAHRYTVRDSAGEIGSQTAMNDKGVVVSGYAGGSVDVGTRRPGLEWQVGVWFATAFADDAEEAVELLTVGTRKYRWKTGNKIVWPSWCWRGVNWVVSDLKEAYVVESIPNDLDGVARYAVRRPGDLGEIGDYIASTNNVEADHSYNEDNVYEPTHPMNQHGNSTQNPTYVGLNGRGMRFWTYMWLIRENYGDITVDMVKDWRTAHYIYDMEGTRHDTLWVEGYGNVSPHLVPGAGTLCAHSKGPPGVDPFTASNIYVSIAVPEDLTIYRTKGRPCEWVGPWDAVSLKKKIRDRDDDDDD